MQNAIESTSAMMIDVQLELLVFQQAGGTGPSVGSAEG